MPTSGYACTTLAACKRSNRDGVMSSSKYWPDPREHRQCDEVDCE